MKGFYTAKAGRLDVYRAANHLLRMVVNGELVLSFKPKGYFANRRGNTEKVPTVLYKRTKDLLVPKREWEIEEEQQSSEDEDVPFRVLQQSSRFASLVHEEC